MTLVSLFATFVEFINAWDMNRDIWESEKH